MVMARKGGERVYICVLLITNLLPGTYCFISSMCSDPKFGERTDKLPGMQAVSY